MKAIINGVNIEGTPYEIAEYVRIDSGQNYVKVPQYPYYGYGWKPQITCTGGMTIGTFGQNRADTASGEERPVLV